MTSAIWAAPPDDRPASAWAFLRGEVTVEPGRGAVTRARLRVTASSAEPARQFVATVFVNGVFVGLTPTRSTSTETRITEIDVSDLIMPGCNAVAALAHTALDRRFWAELQIELADGSTVISGSGPSWRALDGGLVYPEAGSIGTAYFAAPVENLDARQFPYGFAEPGFDDSSWSAAMLAEPFTDLVASPTGGIVVHRPRPVSVERADGAYRLDFGRTWVGGLDIAPLGAAGDVWEIRYGQVRDDDGAVAYPTSAGNTYRDRWTLDGSGRAMRTWGLRVFRHVDILGAPSGLTAGDLTALAYCYPLDRDEAAFDCDDQRLTRIWQLSRDTVEATNLDLYVDSWERERCPYEADAYLQLRAHLALSGDDRLGRYSIDYLLQRRTWPTEWPLYLVLAVADLYRHSGDLSHVARAYPDLVDRLPTRWLDPGTGLVTKITGADGGHSSTDADLVDWPAAERDGYLFGPTNTVVNALAHRCWAELAALARVLGYDRDHDQFAATAERLRAAINTSLWDESAGTYVDGLNADGRRLEHHAVHAALFPLAFGVVPAERVDRVVDHLRRRRMACSVYAAAFEIEALLRHGHAALALELLTSDDLRSFSTMIGTGTGATMEAWHPTLKPNTTYSHPWSAWPAYLLPYGIFGVRPMEPGWARFEVRPDPGPLRHVASHFPTPRGRVALDLSIELEESVITIEVPTDTEAVLVLDRVGGAGHQVLGAGRHRVVVTAPDR